MDTVINDQLNIILTLGGKFFENLVGNILLKKYPNLNFQQTSYSHDGGKDFFSIDGENRIWAEAKCHKRHLELSKIAGTFIMADICNINQIIIFSVSEITKNALINLTKYVRRQGKTLIVYSGEDIIRLISTCSPFEKEEIVSVLKKNGYNFDETNDAFTPLETIDINMLMDCKNNNLMSKIHSFRYFNYIIQQIRLSDNAGQNIDVLSIKYYHFNTGTEIDASIALQSFSMFNVEVILKNNNISEAKTTAIDLKYNIYQCILKYSSDEQKVTLLPGHCKSIVYYFKVLNSAELKLPKILVSTANEQGFNNLPLIVPCKTLGETPYIGKDSEKFNFCCNTLLDKTRKAEIIVVYGKSGVGKTRFIYEFQSARIQSGNKCFIFNCDNYCNSVQQFIKQIVSNYYNLSEIGKINNIKLNKYWNQEKDISDFVESVLNDNVIADSSVFLATAKRWFSFVLLNSGLTVLMDNTQSLNVNVLNFIVSTFDDIKISDTNYSKSEVVFVFNTDVMLKDSNVNKIFEHLKLSVKAGYSIELTGFDAQNAKEYLINSLDPYNKRNDLFGLCEKIVKTVGTNPLILKQIIIYLYQKGYIGYRDKTICILHLEPLRAAVAELPRTIYDVVSIRYNLLANSYTDKISQINDLFWTILLLGKLPSHRINEFDFIDKKIINSCVELGFLKFTDDKTAYIFEHQLIAKSLLLILENRPYEARPFISKIGISKKANKTILRTLSKPGDVIHFVLNSLLIDIDKELLERTLTSMSLSDTPDYLLVYIVNLLDKYICANNEILSCSIKIKALYSYICNCQDKLGIRITRDLFKNIIEYQMDNYVQNSDCAESFLELLKYYQYELPKRQRTDFLDKMATIGEEILNSSSDFKLWIIWAKAKAHLYLYDFVKAKQLLDSGLFLANKQQNNHRKAEFLMQYASLYAYQENRTSAKSCWEKAFPNFKGDEIYNRVLSKIAQGNVLLLNYEYDKIPNIVEALSREYHKNECYHYLKSVINDFLCNYLILKMIDNNEFNEEINNNIILLLNRFRALALGYSDSVYFYAIYKTLQYYKFILSNYSDYIGETSKPQYISLINILSIELLSNYDWTNKDFIYFYPIFKDISEISHTYDLIYHSIENLIPSDRKTIFDMAYKTDMSYILPPLIKGIFSDKNEKIHLLHYSYIWQ